jgi:hypothetical protein
LSIEPLEGRFVPSQTWIEQGPTLLLQGPGINEFRAQGYPTTGAVEALAVDPTNADVVYAGTVNGGVWKSNNATSPSPTWVPLTDQQLPYLDINSLAVSPINPNVIYAGPGPTSSLGFRGAQGFGVARSLDGGAHWQVLGANVLAGQAIRSIVPTTLNGGQVVLAASLYRGNRSLVAPLAPGGGVYRSTDGGSTWTQLSGAPGTGLPAEGVSDLVADPGNPERFYAGVSDFTFGTTGNEGVYRSDDGGQTWAPVNTGLTGLNKSMRILLAVHNSAAGNAVYASVISQDGKLGGVFRSADQGNHWGKLGTPSIDIYFQSQGSWQGAIVADSYNPNVVYISGDVAFFDATVYRGDASQKPQDVWTNVVDEGANSTGPHSDSRAMVFDDNGNLLEASDGGVARLSQPDDPSTRQWSFISFNLADLEFHSVAYDPLSRVIFGGTQDNAVPMQTQPASGIWKDFLGQDGGDVAVDADQTAHPGTTIRYTSTQFLGLFNRSTWDANNNLLSQTFPTLSIVAGPGAGQTLSGYDSFIEFYDPLVLNTVDPTRLLIGTKSLYESFNQGDTLTNLNFSNGSYVGGRPTSNNSMGEPLVYGGYLGGVANPDLIWAGVGNQVIYREHLGDPLQAVPGYQGGFIRTIVADPHDYRRIFVVDSTNQVWSSSDAGQSFENITGNLQQLTAFVNTLEVVSPGSSSANKMLVAGGANGVFALRLDGNGPQSWSPLGSGLPHVLVADLHFYPAENLLLAGTLGRGAWTLTDPFGGTVSQSPATLAASNPKVSLAPALAAPLLVGLLSSDSLPVSFSEPSAAAETSPPHWGTEGTMPAPGSFRALDGAADAIFAASSAANDDDAWLFMSLSVGSTNATGRVRIGTAGEDLPVWNILAGPTALRGSVQPT